MTRGDLQGRSALLAGRGRGRRRGLGALVVLACIALGVLAIVGIQQGFFASHLSLQAARVTGGSAATALADSAVNESLWRFESGANDPSSPLFERLRREVLAPHLGALDLTDILGVEQARRLTSRPEYRSCSLERCEAQVVYQRQFEDLPFERFGLVRFRARVASRPVFGPSLVRDVEVARSFKVVLATVPRPFDQCALFVGEAGSVTDLPALNRKRQRYLEQADETVRWLEEAQTWAPPELAPRYARALSAAGTPDSRRAAVPVADEDPKGLLFGNWPDDLSFSLQDLDPIARLERDEAAFSPDFARLRESRAALQATTGDVAAHEAYLRVSDRALRNLTELLARFWVHKENFRTVGTSDPLHARVAARLKYLRLEHWRRLAFFVLRESAAEGGINAQFAKLRERLQPLNGVVLVENSSEPLRLSGQFRGKLVVVVTQGGVVLDGVNQNAREQDLLSVVSLGGPVTLSGEMHATVAMACPAEGAGAASLPPLVVRPDTRLHGGLVLEKMPARSELAGRLYRDSRFDSGTTGPGPKQKPRPSLYVVGVGPVPVYRRVERR